MSFIAVSLVILSSLFVPADHAGVGPVMGIRDGDSIVILVNENPILVQLAHVDAPELGQPYGEESKQSLSALCTGQYAAIYKPARDDEGNMVASVLCAGQDAGAHQVETGMAVAMDDHHLEALEHQARLAHRGLWAKYQRRD